MGGVAVIYPDGCRDLIRRQLPGQRPDWFVTQRDWSARQVRSAAGTAFAGFRMTPGQGIDARVLDALGDETDLNTAHAVLCDAIAPDPRVSDCLTALETASDLAQACKAVGALEAITQPGWATGEQISTSVPSGVLT